MKSFSVKFAGIFAVAAFALTAVASAQTTAELQAMIAQLQAQIAAASTSSSTTSTTFTRDLTLGSTGADVTALQTWLESKGFLTIPAGVSKGYFGEMTRAALAKYQVSAGISPAAGYFGPATRAKVAAEGGSTTTTTTTSVSGGETSLEDEDLQGEDDAEEGEMKQVATFEFDVEDADAQVDRLDLEFTFDGQNDADTEAWDVFETITLMVDGEEIAEVDVDEEDEWLRDDSPFTFRVTDIDFVAEEGETIEIEIYVTAMDNVDGASAGDAEWLIAVADDGLRATDGQGIQNYVGDASDTVAFEVDVLGEGEDLVIKSSADDIDESTLLVDTDEDSEWHDLFVFNIEAEENDIEIDTLVLEAVAAGDVYNQVVNDIVVEIDGQEFDDVTITNGGTDTATLSFDIDGELTIDGDEEVEVVVKAEFNQTTGNYTDGTQTIQISTVSVDGEGMDDVSDTATVTGEAHTLSTSVAEVTNVTSESTVDDPNNSGVISFEFTVSAEEEDVTFDVVNNAAVNGSTDDVAFTITGTDLNIDVAALTLVSDANDATYAVDTWTINEGEEATFVLDVTFTTVDAGDNGSYRVRLDSVAGTSVDVLSSALNLSF